jgi:signal transduction histidine kinase
VREAYARCLETGEPTTIEIRALTPSGKVRNLSGVIECAQDESGRVVRLAGTLLDITARKRAEEEKLRLEAALRRSEMMAAMGALVGGVAHEVRNPIFGMTATLDAVEARFAERPELTAYLEVLRGELNRLSDLMRELLEYGRPYAHELTPDSIGSVIEAAVAACAGAAKEAGIDIVTTGLPLATRVPMERGRLQQVFENLVRNALQFAPRGSRVEVTARETQHDDAACVECVVADRGPGIAEEDLKSLFEPFFSRRRGGTGLGLSIVHRIVEEHRGAVIAANRQGGGAMMTVRLPVETA